MCADDESLQYQFDTFFLTKEGLLEITVDLVEKK